jgi:hypothetical protein
LLLAYRQQGRHADARTLEQRLFAPSLASAASSPVGSAAGPLAGFNMLGGLAALGSVEETARKEFQLSWEDWRELLPLDRGGDVEVPRVSSRGVKQLKQSGRGDDEGELKVSAR